ncbi:MAG: hypothetical protein MJZ51_02615 [Bacteroidales bacterium]|nr:hypothetical protein [Bacteroidales bacterium]
MNIIKYSEQRDEETGLSCFGARFYDADRTTGWLSVDPMMDKYPSMSPYNYCAGNPVKLVDPDGNDVWEVSDDGHIKKTSEEGGFKRQTLIYSNGQVVKYKGAKYHQVLYDLSNEGDNSISASYGNSNMQSVYATVFKSMADNTNVEWRMDWYTDGHYSLGTLHNQRKSPSSYDLSNGRQNDKTTVTLIHSHPTASGYPNPETVESQKSSMGYWGQKGLAGDAYKKRYTSLKNTYYYTYFPKTNQLWSVGTFRPAFIRNIRSAADFFFGTFNTR